MSRINVLLSTMGPGSSDLLRWDLGTKRSKDLTLTFKEPANESIAELALKIEYLFAVDSAGEEHFVAHLGGERLQVGSNTRGSSLQLDGPVDMQAGNYQFMRFYITEGSSKTYHNRVTEKLDDLAFIDFSIENGLTVETGDVVEFQLTFKLSSFSFRSFWDSYGELLFAPWMRGRLGNMF